MGKRYKVALTDAEAQALLGKVNSSGQYKFNNQSKRDEIRSKRDEIRKNKETRYEEYIKEAGIDKNSVSAYWDKSEYYSILVRPDTVVDDINYDFIKEAVKSMEILPIADPVSNPNETNEILRVIITDVHVGMETDEKGYGIYPRVWNEEELINHGDRIISEVSKFRQKFKEVHVIDLGDYLDGWNGQTTRGGHSLPQNMSNRKAFKVGVSWKINLYNRLQQLTSSPVIAHNVCNDNHSSDFGYIVNETVKQVCELQNPNITVNNHQSFISHYISGRHCFILCHGKDEAHMKFGLKVKLDPVIESKIKQYIDYHKLNDYYITFEKGDSHQQLLDSTSSEYFDYHNYRAFSPASAWVKHNFKLGTCGFTLMIIEEKDKNKTIKAVEI